MLLYWMKMVIHYCRVIQTEDFLKQPGCINTTVNIISPIQPAIRILLCYAIGDNPYGPFTYTGRILNPVVGWTNRIIPLLSLMVNGICFIMIQACQKVLPICVQ